jgi:hypothetical protein
VSLTGWDGNGVGGENWIEVKAKLTVSRHRTINIKAGPAFGWGERGPCPGR